MGAVIHSETPWGEAIPSPLQRNGAAPLRLTDGQQFLHADRFANLFTRSARSSQASAFARRRALAEVSVVLVATARNDAAKDRYSASLLTGSNFPAFEPVHRVMVKTCWRDSFHSKSGQRALIGKPVMLITVLAGGRA